MLGALTLNHTVTWRLTCRLALALAAALSVPAPALAASDMAPPAALGPAPPLDAERSPTLYLALIRQIRLSGKPYAALAHLDEFDRRYRRNDDAQILRGDCWVDVADYAKADAIYRRLTSGPVANRAYRGLGRSAGLRGNWKQAGIDFAEAVRRDPTDPDLLNDLGFALMKSGDLQGAVFRLRQAHELAPGDARTLNNLILALSAAGDRVAAEAALAKLDPAARAQLSGLIAAAPPFETAPAP